MARISQVTCLVAVVTIAGCSREAQPSFDPIVRIDVYAAPDRNGRHTLASDTPRYSISDPGGLHEVEILLAGQNGKWQRLEGMVELAPLYKLVACSKSGAEYRVQISSERHLFVNQFMTRLDEAQFRRLLMFVAREAAPTTRRVDSG